MKNFTNNKHAVSNVLGYTFAFSITSLMMLATVTVTTSIIDNRTNEIIALEAQSIANKVADAIIDAITVKQYLPNSDYTEFIDIPLDLLGKSYYIEFTSAAVYVNTSDAKVSRRCTNYNTKDFDFDIWGKITGDVGRLSISYIRPEIVLNLDFNDGNITDHSPVQTGYYHVSQYSDINKSKWGDGTWGAWWDDDLNVLTPFNYTYRIPIRINNEDPDGIGPLYTVSINQVPVKVVLTEKEIDFNKVSITGDPNAYSLTDIKFVDPADVGDLGDPFKTGSLPFLIDYYEVVRDEVSHIEKAKVVFLVSVNLTKDTADKYIYMYFGRPDGLRSESYPGNVSEFYDNFEDKSANWNKTYDGSYLSDVATGVDFDGIRSVYVVGYGSNLESNEIPVSNKDWWIKKFDKQGYEYKGVEGWNKTVDGRKLDDEAKAVHVDKYGDIYVVGYGTNIASNGVTGKDWWIKKFNSEGVEYSKASGWDKKIDGGGEDDDVALSVTTDNWGEVYVVGYCTKLGTGKDYWVKKFQTNGDEIWEIKDDGGSNLDDEICDVAIETRGSHWLYIVGYGTDLQGPGTGKDWIIRKYDRTVPGAPEKEEIFDYIGGDDIAYSVAINRTKDDGDIFVAGCREDVSPLENDWWIKKLSSDLVENDPDWPSPGISWDGNHSDDFAYQIETYLATSDEGKDWDDVSIYVVGSGNNRTDATFPSGQDWFLQKYNDTTGQAYGGNDYNGWDRDYSSYTALGEDEAYSIATDPNNRHLYIVGKGDSLLNPNVTTEDDWWLKKFTEDGRELYAGIVIDPEVWDISDIWKVTDDNLVPGRARLRDDQFILSKYYRMNNDSEPNDGPVMYIVDTQFYLNSTKNGWKPPDNPRPSQAGSLILLSSSNGTYSNSSYVVSLDLRRNDTQPSWPSVLDISQYNMSISTEPTVLEEISIPTPVAPPYKKVQEKVQDIRLRSYILIDNSSPTPYTHISSFVYDCQGNPGKPYAPFNVSLSFKDEDDFLLDHIPFGHVGFRAENVDHKAEVHDWMNINWIRVINATPSAQPNVTIGAVESINFGFIGNGADLTTLLTPVENTAYHPFFPDPANVDYIKIPDGMEFVILNTTKPLSAEQSRNYMITIVTGDMSDTTDECNIFWKAQKGDSYGNSTILPATERGEFKKKWFMLEITNKTQDIYLRFGDGIPPGDPDKAISSITIEVVPQLIVRRRHLEDFEMEFFL